MGEIKLDYPKPSPYHLNLLKIAAYIVNNIDNVQILDVHPKGGGIVFDGIAVRISIKDVFEEAVIPAIKLLERKAKIDRIIEQYKDKIDEHDLEQYQFYLKIANEVMEVIKDEGLRNAICDLRDLSKRYARILGCKCTAPESSPYCHGYWDACENVMKDARKEKPTLPYCVGL